MTSEQLVKKVKQNSTYCLVFKLKIRLCTAVAKIADTFRNLNVFQKTVTLHPSSAMIHLSNEKQFNLEFNTITWWQIFAIQEKVCSENNI